ncbi:MAG: 3'-5' exonuclease [Clostridia bacterium]|nr:3'-5' exonuclease [Clostridia bacterium]
MKILFFDMEFADGKVPGSIYSFGYTVTDGEFRILTPPTDLLIHPESTWNEYVEKNILAYPKEEVEAAPNFAAHYPMLCDLFASCDLAVGFALNNDLRALRKDCARYDLPPIPVRSFDTERLCRMLEEHKDAHGLGGYVKAWCGEEPDHRHRSDGDAYATMLLFRAICRAKHVTPEMLLIAFPECTGEGKERKAKEKKPSGQRARSHSRRRKRKPSAKAAEKGSTAGNAPAAE